MNIPDELLDQIVDAIESQCTAGDYNPLTDILFDGFTPRQLLMLDRDISVGADSFHVLAIREQLYDDEGIREIGKPDYMFFDAWRVDVPGETDFDYAFEDQPFEYDKSGE